MKAFILVLSIIAISLCTCKQSPKAVNITTTREYELGESLFNVKNDSSFFYFYKVASTSKDSLEVAMAYNYMAAIQSFEGDYFGAQESLLVSLRYLDEKKLHHHYCLTSDYNELGNTNLNLKNYTAAINYYDQALKFTTDDNVKLIVLNGKAVVYQKQGLYTQAITIYRSILNQSKKNQKEYARVLSNYAKARWLQDPGYKAAPELLMAMQIRKNENDYQGLNASYAHLSEYYFSSYKDSALFYASKMYTIARHNQSPDDELEALKKLIELSKPGAVKYFFSRYQVLNDSVQTVRNTAKNQFALIRYESEKNKAENMVLQKDNTEKKIQIIKQRYIISGIALFVLAGVIISATWYRKRKQEMELKAQNAIQGNNLKTSQKVHDVVANGLYRIMTEIEHAKTIDKEILLDKIELLYNKSRDISYEDAIHDNFNWKEILPAMLMSFANSKTKVSVKGYNEEIWENTDGQIKKEMEQILQELMINMKKHSSAQNVTLIFERQPQLLKIEYIDDGVGFPPAFRYGNGLRNTENRIHAMGGQVTFDGRSIKGLNIQLIIPIESSHDQKNFNSGGSREHEPVGSKNT